MKDAKLNLGKEKDHKQDEGVAGFSLLETVFSMLLMSVVGLGATSLFFFAVRNSVSAGDREMAMAVAQQRMEQLRNDSFSSTNLAATASPTPATVTRGGRPYSVTTTVEDSNVVNGSATSKKITIKVVPDNDSVWARTVAGVFGSVTLITQRSAQSTGPNRVF